MSTVRTDERTKTQPTMIDHYGPFKGQRVYRWEIDGVLTWAPSLAEALVRVDNKRKLAIRMNHIAKEQS